MKKQSLVTLASVLLLVSCGSVPDRPEFVDTVANSSAQHAKQPERIKVDLEADCKEGVCEVSEPNLDRLVLIITKLNDEVETRVTAYNALIDALHHCQHQNNLADYQIQLLKNEATQQKYINLGKSALYMAVCGAGLIYGN